LFENHNKLIIVGFNQCAFFFSTFSQKFWVEEVFNLKYKFLQTVETSMNLKITKTFRNRLERIYLFANTDYYVRYYGSKLGILWAFLNPFFQILIFYFVFSYLIFLKSDPSFILYLFTGIITWQFFSEATNGSITLFLKQRYILQNIGLPKVDFFWSLVASKFWGYFINFIIFILFDLVFFHPVFSIRLLYLIPIWLGLILFTLGVSFFLSTLFIFFRDLNHLWDIILMAGFWTVPVIWDYHIIFKNFSFMLLNPVTAFMINIRQVVLSNEVPDLKSLIIALVISTVFAVSGYFFMKFKSKKALEFL
jgi:ABC-type polysaccharide/polyol phosphate export permease